MKVETPVPPFATVRSVPRVMEPLVVTLPALSTLKSVVVAKAAVEEEMKKGFAVRFAGTALIESVPAGVLVPIPRAPVEVKVEVAVVPKCAVREESWVEDARENLWSTVHMFVFARLSSAVREEPTTAPVPLIVTEVPERVEVATDWYVPPPPPYRSCPDGAVVDPVPPRATVRVPVVSEIAIPRDEVAMAVTFPVAPVVLPRMVLAAT